MHQAGRPQVELLPVRVLAPRAMRVLVVGRDRQFRRMARLLFERRGSEVATGADVGETLQLVRRHGAEVVVLDVSDSVSCSLRAVAAIAASAVPVGVVLVSAGSARVSDQIPVLQKWGPFEDLFAEVERVSRSTRGATRSGDVDA